VKTAAEFSPPAASGREGAPGLTRAPTPEQVMAQAGSENFPVASFVLPRAVRADLLAIYGFARLIDDAGDESEGDRAALLDELEVDLGRVWGGAPRHPLLVRLAPTVARHRLPPEPFRALIEANRRDQLVHDYRTMDELLGYCALSANPVGELVLRIFGLGTPARIALSDKVCSALQLLEHWQDVGEDHAAGRIYLPAEDRARHGVAEAELGAPSASPALRALLAYEVAYARELLDAGAPLIGTMRGRPRLAVSAFVAGGRAGLRAIERVGYDVLGRSASAGPRLRLWELVRTLARGGRR
jgi:squalene synthase HpnC